ncbi:MAG: hypothetical protein ABIJ09_14720 [Pseudomonadota bacterium]
MRSILCGLVLVLSSMACSEKKLDAPPPPTAEPSAPAGNIAPPPAAAGFAGSCTVTVSGTVVCTDYKGNPEAVKQGCTKSASATITTAFAESHCSTDGLTGTCAMPNGSVNHYYAPAPVEAMETACRNGGGSWSKR